VTNDAVFSTQPMFEVFNPARTGLRASAPDPMFPKEDTANQLNAEFTTGAESQHDSTSRALIDGLLVANLAWSAWERHRRK
jgi:hypothetical protein